jgi:NodT family efflux transporter outer membrane factor (OMF) lipoprotein
MRDPTTREHPGWMHRLTGVMVTLTFGLALSGCTVLGPDFKAPTWMSPASWFTPDRPKLAPVVSLPAAEPIDPAWWSQFGDAQLTALVRMVAAQNLDVQLAAIRLEQARYQVGIAMSAELPSVNAGGAYLRQKSSRYGILTAAQPSTSAASGTSTGVTGSPTRRFDPYDIFQGGFDASWEIDVWGRVKRAVESAQASEQAMAELRRGILLTSIAEVARTYILLRGTQAQARIARDNLKIAEQSLTLTQARAAGGVTTDLDVANASAQLRRTAAELPLIQQREAALINGLSLLLGQGPNTLRQELESARPVPPVPKTVPIGLPSELVRRRPDVREASATLHAATANIGVAEAEFYPTFRLGGSLGMQTLQFHNLFNLAATTFAIGPSVTIPIFEGGRLKSNLALQEARQKEAALRFQRTVLTAWHEVDNALTAYQAEQSRRDELIKAVRDSQRALTLAQSRYEQGVSDFLTVLETQRLLLGTQQQLQISATNVSENLVALYKALGGGWEPDLPETAR